MHGEHAIPYGNIEFMHRRGGGNTGIVDEDVDTTELAARLFDHRTHGLLVGDIRFAMLPTSSRPLWSVRCGPGGTPAETTLRMDRRLDDGDWDRLLDLLTGADPRYFPIP